MIGKFCQHENAHITLRYFDSLNNVLEEFNETTGNIKQNIVHILSKYNSILFLSAYFTDYKFKFWQTSFSVNFLLMKIKWSYLLIILYSLHKTLWKGSVICYLRYWCFCVERFGHFSIFWKYIEVLNVIFDFKDMERDSLLGHVPKRWLYLFLDLDKMSCRKIFLKQEMRRMSLSNLVICWRWQWEKRLQ